MIKTDTEQVEKTDNEAIQGTVFEIERFAINDGPGIRTLIFLVGCPLKCIWCSNPESQKPDRKLMVWKNRCLGCKHCISQCETGALSWDNGIRLDRSKCNLCGKCTEVCNSNALTMVGALMSVAEVFAQVDKDATFYQSSGGGVTFSGGEAFAQPKFLLGLAKAAKARGYHTCVETTGYVAWDVLRDIMPYIDLFLYDFKQMDNQAHQKITGVSNELILSNYKRLVEYGKKTVARVPVIPDMTDSEENYQLLAEFLKKHNPCSRIDLLPYHRLGTSKYERLGTAYSLKNLLPPSAEKMEEIKAFFEGNGFNVLIGG